jgi:hypothetical protein
MKYYLKKDFSSAFEFLKKCDKTCENWNIDKLIKYDYVVEVCDENDNIINVSFIEIYGRYVRIAIAYYTHDLSIRNLMWIKTGIAEHCMKWFSSYKGLFVSYHEKNLKLFLLCKHKLKNGSGKFLSSENYWFQKFKIEKDKKIWFKHCWQYIAFYSMGGTYEDLLDIIKMPVERENIIITFQTEFTKNHGGFNLDIVKKIAKSINYKVCVIGWENDDTEIDYFIPMPKTASLNLNRQRPNDSSINFYFVDYINKNKIAINNLLFFMEWHLWPNLKPFRDVANTVFSFSRIVVASLVEVCDEIKNSDIMLSYEKMMMKETDFVLCGSNGIKNDIDRHYSNFNKTFVIEIFSSRLKELANYKKKVANPFSKNVIYVGRTDYQKGFHRIKTNQFIVRHLTPKYTLWEDGPKENLIKNWHTLLEDEMFILLPALYETRGLIIQEARALGLIPLVQNNSFGLAEQTTHGVDGFLVDFNESVDDILKTIFGQYDLMHLLWMSENNRQLVEHKRFEESFINHRFLFNTVLN